jgi:hypothetical protein
MCDPCNSQHISSKGTPNRGKMKIEHIKGDGTRPPAPYERAANEINEMLAVKYRKSDGTNDYASIYNALGAFSGFGIQMAIREALVNPGKMPEDKAFVVVKTKDGKIYYFGELLNGGLFGTPASKISVWSLIGAAAHTAGAKRLPDIHEMASHTAKVLGTKDFGIPRVPKEFQPRETPYDVLRSDWTAMQELLVRHCVEPQFWGWTFAQAAQYLILRSKDAFDPAVAATIAMEAAISMSKIDPRNLSERTAPIQQPALGFRQLHDAFRRGAQRP